ncbi:unnamed protein product [Ectocarpus sp. 4 AP-2014]
MVVNVAAEVNTYLFRLCVVVFEGANVPRQGVLNENMPGHTGDWNMYFTWGGRAKAKTVCESKRPGRQTAGHAPEITVDGAPAKPATMDRSALGHFDEFTADGFLPPCHPRQSQNRYHLCLEQPSAIS